MSKNTEFEGKRKASLERPQKPYPSFPLTPHSCGKWQKKIRGKIVYFGRWGKVVDGQMQRLPGDGWKNALELYKAQADDLHAGRTPRTKSGDGLTVAELCNSFRTVKLRRLEAGEIAARMYAEYVATTDLLTATFGGSRLVDDLAADDFETLRQILAKRYGPVRLGNEVGKVKTVFKFGFSSGLIKSAVRYGDEFRKPSASVMRRHRAKNGGRMIEAADLRKLILTAPQPLQAMIFLGLNCGFGNHDVALLPMSAVNLATGWLDFPRPKTGIARRCPLWPETVEAIKTAIVERPEVRQEGAEALLFITARGRQWLSGGIAHPVAVSVGKLMKAAGLHHRGIGFYTLRHVFRTIADAARDPVAVNSIMGHADPSMGAVYREHIADERLKAVTDFVRAWLYTHDAPKVEGVAS